MLVRNLKSIFLFILYQKVNRVKQSLKKSQMIKSTTFRRCLLRVVLKRESVTWERLSRKSYFNWWKWSSIGAESLGLKMSGAYSAENIDDYRKKEPNKYNTPLSVERSTVIRKGSCLCWAI